MSTQAPWNVATTIPEPLELANKFKAQAWHIAENIKLPIKHKMRAHAGFVTLSVPGGLAVVFRIGVVVFFNIERSEQIKLKEQLGEYLVNPYSNPETETLNINIDGTKDGVVNGAVVLSNLTIDKLIVIADVLAKSEVIDYCEQNITDSVNSLQPLTTALVEHGKPGKNTRELLRSIGSTLAIEYEMVAKAEVIDRPEFLWDKHQLDPLFDALCVDFEIKERYSVLEQKASLNARTAQTALGVLEHNHGARLEWYIIVLIGIEIALELWGMFFQHA